MFQAEEWEEKTIVTQDFEFGNGPDKPATKVTTITTRTVKILNNQEGEQE